MSQDRLPSSREKAIALAKETDTLLSECQYYFGSLDQRVETRFKRYLGRLLAEEMEHLAYEIASLSSRHSNVPATSRVYLYAFQYYDHSLRFGIDILKERESMIWIEGWRKRPGARALPVEEFLPQFRKLSESVSSGDFAPEGLSAKKIAYDLLKSMKRLHDEGLIIS